MSRALGLLAALAVVAMVAVISAGCGGTRSSDGTSTAVPAGKGTITLLASALREEF